MTIFRKDEFGAVRAVTLEGEPWFVAADVCRALGLEQTHKVLNRLDEDEVGGGIKIPHPHKRGHYPLCLYGIAGRSPFH